MLSSLNRIITLSRRARAARALGLNFSGTTSFAVPKVVRLAGQTRELRFPNDPAVALDVIDLWLDDDYGLSQIKTPVRTIIDVGANVGLFSLWAWKSFPNATIHAYEPNSLVATFARKNLQGLRNVEVFVEGLSDEPGRAQLGLANSSPRTGILSRDEGGDCTLTAFREAVARIGGTVDLLKLDCEGGEWDIFRDHVSFANVSHIRMEYHLTNGRQLTDLCDCARHLGFEVTDLRENDGFGIAYLKNSRI